MVPVSPPDQTLLIRALFAAGPVVAAGTSPKKMYFPACDGFGDVRYGMACRTTVPQIRSPLFTCFLSRRGRPDVPDSSEWLQRVSRHGIQLLDVTRSLTHSCSRTSAACVPLSLKSENWCVLRETLCASHLIPGGRLGKGTKIRCRWETGRGADGTAFCWKRPECR